MVKEKKPDILFLMETKCRNERMEGIRVKLGFQGLFVVEPVRLSGGLALLWRDHHPLEIQNYTRRHINAVVKHNAVGVSWKLTCFYGHHVAAKRHKSWALLKHLKQFSPIPWVCIEDFNEILTQEEKTGAVLRKERQMDQFQDALDVCNLRDLGYSGARYTWNNSRHDENFVLERLDWALANSQWKAIYRVVNVYVLAGRASEHKPIFLQLGLKEEDMQEYHRSFKFEAKWQLDEEFTKVVKKAWSGRYVGATGIQTMHNKLAACQKSFIRYSGAKFRNAKKIIKKKTKELEALQNHEDPGMQPNISRLKKEIEFLMEQEDVKWKQRAKQNWYQNGDQNTPFFHAWVDHRRRINHISSIVDEEGRCWKKKKEISRVFIAFYQHLFTSERHVRSGGVSGSFGTPGHTGHECSTSCRFHYKRDRWSSFSNASSQVSETRWFLCMFLSTLLGRCSGGCW